MGCRCKDNRENINQGLKYFEELKQLFIKRMTEDSETQDRRRKDFNQAIFHYYDEDDIRALMMQLKIGVKAGVMLMDAQESKGEYVHETSISV